MLRACAMLMALALLGCSAPASLPADRPPTLTIHVENQDERVLGPLGMLWFLVFLGLTEGQEGHEGSPRLLDAWEHNEDFTEWTLHVREGLVWGDGQPVTARDVEYSLGLWTDPEVGYEYAFFDRLEIVDDRTLRMTFPDPPPASPYTYNWLAMLPAHLLQDHDIEDLFAWPFWVEPVGNGPYRYVRHIPDVMTELEANPRYYGEPPRIERVVLRYGGNSITELLSGNADIASGIDPLQAGRLQADPQFRVYYRIDQTVEGIAWNQHNPLFADASVRRALTMAIDRRGLLQAVNLAEDTTIVDVPVLPRHLTEGSVPAALPFDPERAGRLLTEAGWIDSDGDGVRERDGAEFRFTLLTAQPTSAQAVFIEAALRRIGVAVEISERERGLFHQAVNRDGNFDAAIRAFNYVETHDDLGVIGYRNAEVERLRDDAWFTIDRDRADTALRAMWEILGEEMPITYLHPRMTILAAHRRVRGVDPQRGLDAVESMWLEGDR